VILSQLLSVEFFVDLNISPSFCHKTTQEFSDNERVSLGHPARNLSVQPRTDRRSVLTMTMTILVTAVLNADVDQVQITEFD
jgi:hypothetical protein